jgi:hypothetical protein
MIRERTLTLRSYLGSPRARAGKATNEKRRAVFSLRFRSDTLLLAQEPSTRFVAHTLSHVRAHTFSSELAVPRRDSDALFS